MRRDKITEAIQKAVAEAVEMHRKLGNPVAVWDPARKVVQSVKLGLNGAPDEVLYEVPGEMR